MELAVSSPLSATYCLAQAGGAAPGGNPFGSLLIMLPLFGLMYFLFIRPQKRRQQQVQEMLSKLKLGDRVMTNGGMLGLISRVSDKTVHIVLADKVEVEFVRSAVAEIIREPETETEKKSKADANGNNGNKPAPGK